MCDYMRFYIRGGGDNHACSRAYSKCRVRVVSHADGS